MIKKSSIVTPLINICPNLTTVSMTAFITNAHITLGFISLGIFIFYRIAIKFIRNHQTMKDTSETKPSKSHTKKVPPPLPQKNVEWSNIQMEPEEIDILKRIKQQFRKLRSKRSSLKVNGFRKLGRKYKKV